MSRLFASPCLHVALLLPVILYFIACTRDEFDSIITEENSFNNVEDLPIPGNSGVISAASITDEGLQLSWSKATDSSTPQAEIEYRVFHSESNNIATPADAESNGTPIGDWAKDATSISVTGLNNAMTYYFNVIVRASGGRKATYSTVMAVTLGTIYLYSVGPFPGNLTTLSGTQARIDIDGRCSPIPVAGPVQARAFISISANDAIKDFPTAYDVPTTWPIRGTGGQSIAVTWADILNGSINDELVDAGVTNAPWWSGSLEDGDFDSTASCANWTLINNTIQGRVGSHDSFAGIWIYDTASYCFYAQRLLCIAW